MVGKQERERGVCALAELVHMSDAQPWPNMQCQSLSKLKLAIHSHCPNQLPVRACDAAPDQIHRIHQW